MYNYHTTTFSLDEPSIEFIEELNQKLSVNRSKIMRRILKYLKENPSIIREILIKDIINFRKNERGGDNGEERAETD